ncbi:MAG: hypothetical protein OEU92_05215 [Alphaproteobacteria bacterium]|nr:hypothetical protein [Alphaproteobacteria bacterium]
MSEEPVDLDEHRGMMAQQATEVRRERIQEFQADQIALQRRQEELERQLLAAPAATWSEAAAKAEYLIQLFAATPYGQTPRCKDLIAHTLDDLSRLSGQVEELP